MDQGSDGYSHSPARDALAGGTREAVTPIGGPAVSLQSALRRARLESAEQSEAVSEVRSADHARLDLLRERLIPVLAEVPGDCDLFDLALAPGEHPRLFVDMIAFVEMARDRRAYRFVQDTRHGRLVISESEGLEATTRAVADYVARRLVEREKALAADAIYRMGPQPAAQTHPNAVTLAPARKTYAPASDAGPAAQDPIARAMQAVGSGGPPRPRPRTLRVVARGFLFLIEALGSAAFFALLAGAAYWAWLRFGQ